MTTSNWRFRDEDFRMISNIPQVTAGVHEAAQRVEKLMRASWPGDRGDKDDIFQINSHIGADGRPVDVILVKHPTALAHQARTGAFSKAIAASGYEGVDGKRGK